VYELRFQQAISEAVAEKIAALETALLFDDRKKKGPGFQNLRPQHEAARRRATQAGDEMPGQNR
jgi:hypothetical protein